MPEKNPIILEMMIICGEVKKIYVKYVLYIMRHCRYSNYCAEFLLQLDDAIMFPHFLYATLQCDDR